MSEEDLPSNESDESDNINKVGEIRQGTRMKYADLKAEIGRCASTGLFKVNHETDSGMKR